MWQRGWWIAQRGGVDGDRAGVKAWRWDAVVAVAVAAFSVALPASLPPEPTGLQVPAGALGLRCIHQRHVVDIKSLFYGTGPLLLLAATALQPGRPSAPPRHS